MFIKICEVQELLLEMKTILTLFVMTRQVDIFSGVHMMAAIRQNCMRWKWKLMGKGTALILEQVFWVISQIMLGRRCCLVQRLTIAKIQKTSKRRRLEHARK